MASPELSLSAFEEEREEEEEEGLGLIISVVLYGRTRLVPVVFAWTWKCILESFFVGLVRTESLLLEETIWTLLLSLCPGTRLGMGGGGGEESSSPMDVGRFDHSLGGGSGGW